MIPFVAIDEAKIAPFHPFGVCVAIGFFSWDYVAMQMAVRRGFDRADFRVLSVWVGVMGWSISWVIDALFYHPDQPLAQRLFAVQGFSSTGAILGATIGGILWSRLWIGKKDGRWSTSRRKEPVALLPVSEVIVGTWPLAFAIGRLGCALIHDHIGKAATPGTLGSLIAIGFPRTAEDGFHRAFGPIHIVTGASDLRYDLGLLELLILAPLAIGFSFTWKWDVKGNAKTGATATRRQIAMGTYTVVASLVYGPLRFLLDFLRPEEGPTGDARHGGLTFAQYWSLAVVGVGIAIWIHMRRRRPSNVIESGDVPPPLTTPDAKATAD